MEEEKQQMDINLLKLNNCLINLNDLKFYNYLNMKISDNLFEEYLNNYNKINFHPELNNVKKNIKKMDFFQI